jgi:hypothetical protein
VTLTDIAGKMNEIREFRFKRSGFFRGWGIPLAILITGYFIWRIGQVIAGSMPMWVAIVSTIVIIYIWYRMLSPVKAIRLSSEGRVIFFHGLGSREVQVEEIEAISPWLRISKRDFILKHTSGREFLFEDPDQVAVFVQELKRIHKGFEVRGMATVLGSDVNDVT